MYNVMKAQATHACTCNLSVPRLMEAGSAKTLKVAIELHEGEHSTKKVWRFNVDSIQQYSRDVVEAEIISLFPHARGGHYIGDCTSTRDRGQDFDRADFLLLTP